MGKFSIGTYVKPESANAWAEDVAELDAAVKANTDESVAISASITLDGKTKDVDLRAIRDAAKKLGRTVRILKLDESKLTTVSVSEKGRKTFGGSVDVTITLTDKYADGRGRKPANATPASEETVTAKASK
jgi:hypothetical protein